MNAKTTLIIAFSKALLEEQRPAVLQDILKIDGVDTVTPGNVAIVEMNDIRSGTRVQKDILKIDGVMDVYSPPVSGFFASDMPQL